jgi:hypothetical protein
MNKICKSKEDVQGMSFKQNKSKNLKIKVIVRGGQGNDINKSM